MNNNNKNSALNKPAVSSSTVIEPINCELSESMKSHIEMLEWTNKLFDESRKQLMIPKEMFGSK
jgi:hypothetical protein